jgi:hypothetical protein
MYNMFMESERIKLRVTRLASLTIERDCQAYGFVKNDGEANRNGLLNHLIPHLYEMRKDRMGRFESILKDKYRRKDYELISSVVSMAFDEAYFGSDNKEPLEDEVWIRPNSDSGTAFSEIDDKELSHSAKTMSEYIRGLLDEYVKLPCYAREQILFSDRISILKKGEESRKPIGFRYNGIKVMIVVCHIDYEPVIRERNYICGFSLDERRPRLYLLKGIASPFEAGDKPAKTSADEDAAIRHFINEGPLEKALQED